jgi:hypothetical protein
MEPTSNIADKQGGALVMIQIRTYSLEDIVSWQPCWGNGRIRDAMGDRERVSMWDVLLSEIHIVYKWWFMDHAMTESEKNWVFGAELRERHLATGHDDEDLMDMMGHEFSQDIMLPLDDAGVLDYCTGDDAALASILFGIGQVPK